MDEREKNTPVTDPLDLWASEIEGQAEKRDHSIRKFAAIFRRLSSLLSRSGADGQEDGTEQSGD